MHGRNLFPPQIPLFRETVLDYMAAMTALAHPDRASVYEFSGTYGEYLLGKVSKVFPELKQSVL